MTHGLAGFDIAEALREAVRNGVARHGEHCTFVDDAVEQLIASDEFAALARKAETLEIRCARPENQQGLSAGQTPQIMGQSVP